MRTSEERLTLLHDRADALKKEKERNLVRGLSGACIMLALGLVAVIGIFGNSGGGVIGEGFAGSSMLSESAGAYVLVAVIAFIAGAAVTLLVRWHKKKKS